MSALLRKEIRLLLPSFAIALVLAFSGWLIPHDLGSVSDLGTLLVMFPFYLLCPVMAVVTALNTFGRELSSGTFADLLSQPVSRSRVWWTKTVLLAVALALIAAAWWFCYLLHLHSRYTGQSLRPMIIGTWMFVFAVFSGGLWTVLLIRQVAAAFWFTLLIPAALLTLVSKLTEKTPEKIESVLIWVFIAYAIAAFFWAKRMFLRAQDAQWSGGTITMPELRGLRTLLVGHGARRQLRPRAVLFAKELQLHQSQLVIAGMLALLHLGVIAARKFGGGFEKSFALEFVASNFWGLWLVMPWLVGCAAVAEERKLGTLEAHLCLPVRRRTQFAIKFAFALLASVLLGVVVPVLFEGNRILPDSLLNLQQEMANYFVPMPRGLVLQTFVNLLQAISPVVFYIVPFMPLCAVSISVAAISFYASTLARSTLQSLAPAVLGILVAWMLLLGAYRIEDVINYPLWHGWLVYLIGVPVMTLVLAWLTYGNFKRVLVGGLMWRRNALVLFSSLALVIVVTSAIYHRVWELVTPLEPPHGAARLTPSPGVVLRSDNWNLVAQLPGGRIWTDRFLPTVPNLSAMLTGDWQLTGVFGGGRAVEGTNWASVAVCHLDVVGIRNDGSLWASEQSNNLRNFWRPRKSGSTEPIRLVRIGNDTPWKCVVGDYTTALLLKTDGTLWRLGTNRVDGRKGWPGLRAFEPQRLGTDADWADLSASEGQIVLPVLRKADGRAWLVYGKSSYKRYLPLDDQTSIERAPQWDDHRWRSRAQGYSPRTGQFQVGVREDGTIRVCATWQSNPKIRLGEWEWVKHDVQLGSASNWLAVAGNGEVTVTLKADGTLWKWDFPDDPTTKPNTARATRISSHSDWMAVCSYENGLAGLAADGSLWFWHSERRGLYPSEFVLNTPLLAVSRKPQLIGNIFGKSE